MASDPPEATEGPARVFTDVDQQRFAELSGDWNTMHMDPVLSRRTQAGGMVVHGMHAVLWSLETMAQAHDLGVLASIEVSFDRFIGVGEDIDLDITAKSDRIIVRIDGPAGRRMRVIARFGVSTAANADDRSGDWPIYDLARRDARVLDLDEAERTRGRIVIGGDLDDWGTLFPRLTAAIGPMAVDALAKTSTIVGMACPGRDSIYSSLKIKRLTRASSTMSFSVTSVERSFRLLTLAIEGGGWSGEIEAFLRHPPIVQPTYAEIRRLIEPAALRGQRVLVIGGSRGIGEVVAKIVAAGGAEVFITYLVGEADARRVAAEITSDGGSCEALRFDASKNPAGQLGHLQPLTHVYYFATSKIFGGGDIYSPERLRVFQEIYVDSFYRLCAYCNGLAAAIRVFYPSSVAVESRPRGMTEYAMAKAAGEVLAADMPRSMRGISIDVVRLPRIVTDQTASLVPTDDSDTIQVMLPLVRAFHGLPLTD
jgi:acyl dehydratase